MDNFLNILMTLYTLVSIFILQEEKLTKYEGTGIVYRKIVGAASRWWEMRGLASAAQDIKMLKQFSGRAAILGLFLSAAGLIFAWSWLNTLGAVVAVLFGFAWISVDWVFSHKTTFKEAFDFFKYPGALFLLVLVADNPPWGKGHFAAPLSMMIRDLHIPVSDPIWIVPVAIVATILVLSVAYLITWMPTLLVAGFLIGGLRLASVLSRRAGKEKTKTWLYYFALASWPILLGYGLMKSWIR